MIIYAADDEPLQLRLLQSAVREAAPDTEIHTFSCAGELLTAMDNGAPPDVAFLDIEMPDIGGLELAYILKKKAPRANVIFVTGF